MHGLNLEVPRYLVLAYLPACHHRFQLAGPVLVETRDYIHFYLTGTELSLDTLAYVVIREYQHGITEEQATDFYLNSFTELLRSTMEYEAGNLARPPTSIPAG